ncbi:MAG TPA: hypothetical protein VHL31_13030 [Geminicoccus sp.]|nr:hypothetical protein [Geminicoccus sp.]
MLSQLTDIGIEVRIEHGSLMLRGHGARPPPDLLERVRAHKRQLLMLLDGSTCRLCQRAVDWRHSAAVALADGTSVHHECRSSSPTRRLPATA